MNRPDAAVAAAALRAARRLGLSRLFLQTLAEELPDEALAGLRLEETPDAVVAHATHLCAPGCDLTAHHCLTALKLQSLLGHRRRSPYAVTHLATEGNHLRARLVPVPRPTPA